jgi:hypothetical protein
LLEIAAIRSRRVLGTNDQGLAVITAPVAVICARCTNMFAIWNKG